MITPDELRHSYHHCQTLARQSRSNFFYTFYTLPRDQFRGMCALYAFMRHTDDLGDDPGLSLEERRRGLDDWRQQLDMAFRGLKPPNPILPALVETVQRYTIVPEHLTAVIDGVESDLSAQTIRTEADLDRYCYQVAGAVGLCCVAIWGARPHGEVETAAIACGRAMQRTNILRDIAEDFAAGRIYLPTETLAQWNCSPDTFARRPTADALRTVIREQWERARSEFEDARSLNHHLNPAGRRILRAMVDVYGAIHQEIARRGFDTLTERITVPRWRKLFYVGRAMILGSRLPSRTEKSRPNV